MNPDKFKVISGCKKGVTPISIAALRSERLLPGYFGRIYVILRMLITFFFYPVNPVRVLRSDLREKMIGLIVSSGPENWQSNTT